MGRDTPLLTWILWVLAARAVHGSSYPEPAQYCFASCSEALAYVAFAGEPTSADYYGFVCQNHLYVQSVRLCTKTYCSPQEHHDGIRYAEQSCRDEGYEFLVTEMGQLPPNATADNSPSVPQGSTDTYTLPALPDAAYFAASQQTVEVWNNGRRTNYWYCWALFLFWGGLLALSTAAKALTSMRASMIVAPGQTRATVKTTVLSRSWTWLQAHLVLPATWGHHCDERVLQFTIPPRIETLVIAAFVALNVVLCAVSYTVFDENIYWSDPRLQIWRYLSDRTGYLAYANLSLLWVFAMRNNTLIWLSGWPFSTFSRFHRWIARVATLQAVIHSVGYTVYSFIGGGAAEYYESFTEEYWYTGVVATVAMCLILPFAIPWVRTRAYDIFLLGHIALSLVTLVNLFYHTKIFLGDFDGFLWVCVAVWVIDRLCRLGRVLFVSLRASSPAARVEYSDAEDLLRIDLGEAFNSWKPRGGHTFYVYTPASLLGWQSHPFTLVKWFEAVQDDNVSNASPRAANENEKTAVASVCSSSPSFDVCRADRARYSLLVRPHKGFTARLRKRAAALAPGLYRPRVLLEGPYSSPARLDIHENVLFIIGGSGISVAISAIYEQLAVSSPSSRMRLVWACRGQALIESVLDRELGAAVKTGRLAVDGFVTQQKTKHKNLAGFSLHQGRPNISREIAEAFEAKQRASLAVVVCGPSSMMDDARAAVVAELRSGQAGVHLFLESFSW